MDGTTIGATLSSSVRVWGIGKFEPKDDITPLDAAWLSLLFATMACENGHLFDSVGYVRLHKLERHFNSE